MRGGPGGRGESHTCVKVTSHVITLFLLRNSEQCAEIARGTWPTTVFPSTMATERQRRVMVVAAFLLAGQDSSAPNFLVYVVASHDRLHGIRSVVPATAHLYTFKRYDSCVGFVRMRGLAQPIIRVPIGNPRKFYSRNALL